MDDCKITSSQKEFHFSSNSIQQHYKQSKSPWNFELFTLHRNQKKETLLSLILMYPGNAETNLHNILSNPNSSLNIDSREPPKCIAEHKC